MRSNRRSTVSRITERRLPALRGRAPRPRGAACGSAWLRQVQTPPVPGAPGRPDRSDLRPPAHPQRSAAGGGFLGQLVRTLQDDGAGLRVGRAPRLSASFVFPALRRDHSSQPGGRSYPARRKTVGAQSSVRSFFADRRPRLHGLAQDPPPRGQALKAGPGEGGRANDGTGRRANPRALPAQRWARVLTSSRSRRDGVPRSEGWSIESRYDHRARTCRMLNCPRHDPLCKG
jgi:hypothetical protein